MLRKLKALVNPALARFTLISGLIYLAAACAAAGLTELLLHKPHLSVWSHTLSVFSVIYGISAWFHYDCSRDRTTYKASGANAYFARNGLIHAVNSYADGDSDFCRFVALACLAVLLQIPSLIMFLRLGAPV